MDDDKNFDKREKVILSLLLVFLFLFSTFFFYYRNSEVFFSLNLKDVENNNTFNGGRKLSSAEQKERSKAYFDSLLSNNPKELQNFFLNDIRNGVNDKYTKSDIYFITHRFFDNGGNIYEIYDYVEANPELTFLKEAENIYPGIFKLIKERKLEPYATDSGYYAYLAYVEVILPQLLLQLTNMQKLHISLPK